MTITLTWQTIITAGSVAVALGTFITLFAKLVRWVDKQKQQDSDIKAVSSKHDEDMDALKSKLAGIQHEQTILTYGLLACLKGLKEQGCNGPVTEAINKIEKYLNQKAHADGE